MGTFGHVRALDGIRGVAVLLVVVSHSIPHTSGGGLGVDIFFTLSGFLITTLLLEEHASRGGVDFRAFYMRRALRLLPAMFVLLALVAVLVAITGSNLESMQLRYAVPAVALYVANWAQSLGSGLGYLAHTWSLSIEEQFYLAWPLILIFLLRRRRSVVPWLAVGVLSSVAFRLSTLAAGLETHGWTVSRADGLLLGCLLASLTHRKSPSLAWASKRWVLILTTLGFAGLVIAASATGGRSPWVDSVAYTGVAMCTAVLIAQVVASPQGWTSRLFSWGPLGMTGRVSYGIYLYHFPALQFTRLHVEDEVGRVVAGYAVTAALVMISWTLIERPALQQKHRWQSRREAVTSRTSLVAT